jgi:stress response protein SCP2
MSINLVKGQKIDLSKGTSGLSKIMVGLGWDPVEKKSGLLGGLFGGSSAAAEVDCDASAILLDEKGKLSNNKNLIYFGNLNNPNRSIIHQGDNLTGDGDGDDEQIMLELKTIPEDVKRVVFVVNIYDCQKRKQDFGMIKNAFIRVVDMAGNKELCKFNLTEDYAGKMSLLVGEIYRNNAEWKFGALGEATLEGSLSEIIRKFK